jgi:hypothetical protein
MQYEIQHVTSGRCNVFNKLFQYHLQKQLEQVGNVATGPRSQFATHLTPMKTAVEEVVCGVVNITTSKRLECLVRLSDAETEAITWSIADMEYVANQMQREICGVTASGQMRFKKEISIPLVTLMLCSKQRVLRYSSIQLNSV